MTTTSRFGMSYIEHKEMVDAARERFRLNEINEVTFRRLLAAQGFNATEIEAEIDLIRKGW